LNRAVAVAHTDGPRAALRELDALAVTLAAHHRFHATAGYVHDLIGDHAVAQLAYLQAAQLATNEPERRYLRAKAES
ncbi:MAG: polymerase sigma factor, partial [Ilumatobacteraceae bacterium]|nr:polymerase sigma factor [Ilumatobacteraceae bacterium]